jgi:drug/metabolite transporter (DMT)-like permease
MPLILAGLSSLTFGIADFVGGFATRRARAISVVVGSQMVSLATVLAAAPFFHDQVPRPSDWAWGATAGMAGSIGLVAFYHALANTRVSIAAPMAAVASTLTPVIFGVAVGERPSTVAWIGIAIAIPAMLTLPAAPRDHAESVAPAALLGGFAGLCFGLFGILISRTAADSGLWPLASARIGSITLMVIVALVWRRPKLPPREVAPIVALAGFLDMLANIFFLLAVRRELLSIVAVIMSFYPAATIALARIIYGERSVRRQWLGIALGAVSVTLIALG